MVGFGTEEEAKQLLVREQTLDNLYAFSDRLDKAYKLIKKARTA